MESPIFLSRITRNQKTMTTILSLLSILVTLGLNGFNPVRLPANETFTDPRDGKTYNTVKIGEQVWMARNLAYDPGNGGALPYGNDPANISVYGYLYDWETAVGVCPEGWHLPGEDEWKALIEELGGMEIAGGKMREVGPTHWKNRADSKINQGATNESGFTALPGGMCSESSSPKPADFKEIGTAGYWWSSDDIYGRYAWFRVIGETETGIGYDYFLKTYRLSVRCPKD